MSLKALPEGRFGILYADPAWEYGETQHGTKKATRSAKDVYETVSTKEMMEWPIGKLAEDNSLLFMWTTSPHIEDALRLGNAWGFKYITVAFVWDKGRSIPGNYTMSQCEICMLFKRGTIPQPRGTRNERQLIREPRREHSRKPDEARERIERMFPTQRKFELFARQQFPGWVSWGLEIVDELPEAHYE